MQEISLGYSNNTQINTNSNSRYYHSNVISDSNNKIVYDLFEPRKLITQEAFKKFTVPLEFKDRLDLVAQKFYSNPTKWWVIAVANNLIDPFILPAGTTLVIPETAPFLVGKRVSI